MWQRFTERARRVVFFAQEEAGRLGENYVASEHLLLGLVRENDSVAARILDRMGVSLVRIRSEIEKQVTPGTGALGQDMLLTPRAKRVIDLAYDEARQLSNNYIGTEHLLLGLIREGEGLASRVLAKLGADLARARKEVKELQDNDSNQKASRTHFRSVVGQINALPAEQRKLLQSEGVVFGDLPSGLQAAILSAFNHASPVMTVDLAEATIRAEPVTPDDSEAYNLMTTAPINLRIA